MRRQANPNQFFLDFSPAVEPAKPDEGTLVARWPDHPNCPGAFIRVFPYALKDSQGRMGTERYPGLIASRSSLLRSIARWDEDIGAFGEPKTEKERSNHAGWLQFYIFQMGGLAAAW